VSEPATPSGAGLAPADRLRLRFAKLCLAAILPMIVIAGNRHGTYPIVNWPMYSRTKMPLPEDRVSVMTIRAEMRDGRMLHLDEHSFLPFGRNTVVRWIMDGAFNSTEQGVRERFQESIASLITNTLRETPARIEVWRTEWAVDPFASPPFDRAAPIAEVLVGTIKPK
jgi:hypothetical protein